MNEVTVRELGGEIWAELFAAEGRGEPELICSLSAETTNALIDFIMSVLARHEGKHIKNDADLPITPLPRT